MRVLVDVTIDTTLADTLSAISAIDPSTKLAEFPSEPLFRKVSGVEDFWYAINPKPSPHPPINKANTDIIIAALPQHFLVPHSEFFGTSLGASFTTSSLLSAVSTFSASEISPFLSFSILPPYMLNIGLLNQITIIPTSATPNTTGPKICLNLKSSWYLIIACRA